jgi:hypothetical protein
MILVILKYYLLNHLHLFQVKVVEQGLVQVLHLFLLLRLHLLHHLQLNLEKNHHFLLDFLVMAILVVNYLFHLLVMLLYYILLLLLLHLILLVHLHLLLHLVEFEIDLHHLHLMLLY